MPGEATTSICHAAVAIAHRRGVCQHSSLPQPPPQFAKLTLRKTRVPKIRVLQKPQVHKALNQLLGGRLLLIQSSDSSTILGNNVWKTNRHRDARGWHSRCASPPARADSNRAGGISRPPRRAQPECAQPECAQPEQNPARAGRATDISTSPCVRHREEETSPASGGSPGTRGSGSGGCGWGPGACAARAGW